MKKRNLIYVTCMLIAMGACSATSKNQAEVVTDTWGKYNVGTILFEDKAPETKGSDVYHRIIPDAESYIKAQAREVLATLYNSPDDSIPVMVMSQSSIARGILRNHLRRMIRQSCFSKRAEYCCTN